MRYCRFCGAQLKDGVKFCSSCGKKLNPEESNQSADSSRPDQAIGNKAGSRGTSERHTSGGEDAEKCGRKKGKGLLILLIVLLILIVAGAGCYVFRDSLFPDGIPVVSELNFGEKKDKGTDREKDREEDDREADGREKDDREADDREKDGRKADDAKEEPKAAEKPAETERSAVSAALEEAAPAAEAAVAAQPAVEAGVSEEIPEYGPLQDKGHCEDVDAYVEMISAMRQAASEYITENTDYLVVGEDKDRKVIYCRVDDKNEALRSLMDEYGYAGFSAEFYFDNDLNGTGMHLCAGPDYAVLRMGKKVYEYYFVGNQMIRRVSENGVQDNPETDDFMASVYSIGHDFADSILNGYGEYIIPDSDSRRLTEEELNGMSDWSLQLARNEIYARHGRRFTNTEIQKYFDSCSWYKGTIEPENFSEDLLNKIEKDNVKLIKKVEER